MLPLAHASLPETLPAALTRSSLTSGCMAMPVAQTQVPNGTASGPPSLCSTATSPSRTSVTLRTETGAGRSKEWWVVHGCMMVRAGE